jgi:hypothetical protein
MRELRVAPVHRHRPVRGDARQSRPRYRHRAIVSLSDVFAAPSSHVHACGESCRRRALALSVRE